MENRVRESEKSNSRREENTMKTNKQKMMCLRLKLFTATNVDDDDYDDDKDGSTINICEVK